MATAIAIARVKDLFASVMLTGIYSLLSAVFFVLMDAVDVAFTEASVGAGISTILMLSTLTLTGQYEDPTRHKTRTALVVVLVTGALLIFGTADMPRFGDPQTPVQTHVGPHYLEKSYEEIHVPNVVTSVLASYRGFDTFGETVVIFAAGIGVLSLLGFSGRKEKTTISVSAPMYQHRILRVVGKVLIPPILLFALYVQFHGDFGPGGGFQAGVIFAAAIILYTMLFGRQAAEEVIKLSWVRLLAAVGVMLYGSVGLISFLNGKNFLDYSALAADAVSGQHYGILLVELGVGITVTAVMILVFFSFAGRVDKKAEENE
ncbi:hypothetical protein TDB9533_03058 [Thalassocella blandensis]|nr:hypothetical protein TDB9533_03058 [Thalassocella blandensis]